MPVTEVFASQPLGTCSTSLTAVSGSGSIVVTPVNAFPTAGTSTIPNSTFRIIDTASSASTEIMLVTVGGGANAGTWSVTRGADGSTPVSHTEPWTLQQVVGEGTLGMFIQGEETATSTSFSDTTATEVILEYSPVPQNAPAEGVCYQFVAFGTLGTSNTVADSELTVTVTWNGTTLCQMKASNYQPPFKTALSDAGFWLQGAVICLSSTTMVAGMHMIVNIVGAGGTTTTLYENSSMALISATATTDTAMTAITVSGSTGPLEVTMEQSAAETANAIQVAAAMTRFS